MTNELGEARDLADEADSAEYQAMCNTVRDELAERAEECGYPGLTPCELYVHNEAMRRLKAKYESACGED